MGNFQNDKLTQVVNLQSFSAPYSPQFFINKSEFKEKSIKQLMKLHLNSELNINSSNQINTNDDNKTFNNSNKNIINIENKDLFITKNDLSLITASTTDEDLLKNVNLKSNSISLSTKKEIHKKEKYDKKIISKIIIQDDTNNTRTTIFTTTSSLHKDINNIYEFKEIIGKGAFGIVRTGFRKKEFSPHRIYAIKSIHKKNFKKREMDNLEKEIDILSSLDHPNIARFYETFHDENYFNIVMELCRGKLLSTFLKLSGGYIDEIKSRIIIMKILHAVNYCHSLGIVHCDLKPDNIIFELDYDENEEENHLNSNFLDIKLVDFGLSSRIKKNQKLKNTVGTPYFISPEMLKGEYDEKCDIWSIGVILYYMISGKFPFYAEKNLEIFEKILNEEPNFDKISTKISEKGIDFIKKCLIKNPKMRPSAKECLLHPWLEPIFSRIRSNTFLEKNLILNFSTYNKCSQFKKLILKYLISNMGHMELEQYKLAFYAFDFKNEGIITVKGIKKIFEIYNMEISDSQIKKIMTICDDPNKAFLTYTEFILSCINIGEILTPEKLLNAFFFFDMDNNMIIDSNDLKNVLLKCGKNVINKKDIDKIILEATKEIDNKININDFIMMYKDDIDVDEYLSYINYLLGNNHEVNFFL